MASKAFRKGEHLYKEETRSVSLKATPLIEKLCFGYEDDYKLITPNRSFSNLIPIEYGNAKTTWAQ